MAFKTTKKETREVVEANFIVDIQKIGKELQAFLSNSFLKSQSGFLFTKTPNGCVLSKPVGGSGPKASSSKYSVTLSFFRSKGSKPDLIFGGSVCGPTMESRVDFTIRVSRQEVYTKEEIEKARKEVFVKVWELLERVK